MQDSFVVGKGELVKFRIFAADDALSCLKRLLPNFVHHQIEMACGLLDTCGRFLYRSPQSHLRTKAYLEVMRRKKTAVHMDQRYVTMIDNSYYYCDPPKTMCQFGAIELTPLQRFLRHLLFRDLDKNSVNRILKLFRKIDWTDQEVSPLHLFLSVCVNSRLICLPPIFTPSHCTRYELPIRECVTLRIPSVP
ncbi:unnamed protein product [Dibothriocephalus latus]|uniref:MIF4G domain-containing protein n=1 Tax=Dibothriocephalus latus TaxID=60516 RepID=A0A3P7MXH9_DIBLA|nr:unnamed protein product [Dibothriocephalus latus]